MTLPEHRREAWDDAILALVAEHPAGLTGSDLLPIILTEATDAIARLKERGLIEEDGESRDG